MEPAKENTRKAGTEKNGLRWKTFLGESAYALRARRMTTCRMDPAGRVFPRPRLPKAQPSPTPRVPCGLSSPFPIQGDLHFSARVAR